MGGHDPYFDRITMEQILFTNAQSVVDVGMGKGDNGRLIKTVNPKCRIIGIDIHLPTIDSAVEHLGDIYDWVMCDDVRELVGGHWSTHSSDVLLMGDVIEHMTKEEGYEVLRRAYPFFKYIIVNTPLGFLEQSAINNNPHEEHISGWYLHSFHKYKIIKSNTRQPVNGLKGLLNVLLKGGKK